MFVALMRIMSDVHDILDGLIDRFVHDVFHDVLDDFYICDVHEIKEINGFGVYLAIFARSRVETLYIYSSSSISSCW
jgi:hypothetical protein